MDRIEEWRTEKDIKRKMQLFRTLYPEAEVEAYEKQAGLYPDIEDPNFLPRLMQKKEFQESKQESVAAVLATGEDKCSIAEEFELSAVQKFLARLLNPFTPYKSALIYHGVGVGKTCTAVTICESYLEQFPGRKAYVIAPPNIQAGFKRTLFDIDSMVTENGVHTHRGCTGNLYLELAGMTTEKSEEMIKKRITKQIDSRYEFFGYQSFYNWIRAIVNKSGAGIADDTLKRDKQNEAIRREFSNRVLIIDEAHNLRDDTLEKEDENIDTPTDQEKKDARQGKMLTYELQRLLEIAENVTLVLMTATPMYNSHEEILFLLNLLLINDKRPVLLRSDVFNRDGTFTLGGKEVLGAISSTYVSFMRGENPLTFPLRLQPQSPYKITDWPLFSPQEEEIDDTERAGLAKLPCLGCPFDPALETKYFNMSKKIATSDEGLGITNMDLLVQAGNWVYPTGEEDLDIYDETGEQGFQAVFETNEAGNSFTCVSEDISWMLEEGLEKASSKAKVLLERVRQSEGVQFVYSRFVRAGALSLALVLEANGYLPWGRAGEGFLKNGNQHPNGMQCALCPLKRKEHTGANHEFKQAYYVLLTGSNELSPKNVQAVNAARSMQNKDGSKIKIILGSQIAGEGLDLRFIREVFVFDSWYHLNKLEQIIGRGIRTCSHAALPEELRNCTITLLVNQFQLEDHQEIETVDMYSYRIAFNKAKVIGQVSRVLKEYAIDCNLNYDAIVMKGIPSLNYCYDSQREKREDVNRNDTPFSPLCDWLDECEYGCRRADGTEFSIDELNPDVSTYDEYSARYEHAKVKKVLRQFFAKHQAFITFEEIVNIFPHVPSQILRGMLNDIIADPDFIIETEHGKGRLISRDAYQTVKKGTLVYKNGYYLFQPLRIKRESIPIAVRLSSISLPRDRYMPIPMTVTEPSLAAVATKEDMDTESVWEAGKAWAADIRNDVAVEWDKQYKGSKEHIPDEMNDAIKDLLTAQISESTFIQKFEMITWLYSNIHNNVVARNILADIMLEYIWDEFLPYETKKMLLIDHNEEPILKQIAQDSYFVFNKNIYLRLLHETTFQIHFFCKSKTGEYNECDAATTELLEDEEAKIQDPLLKKGINLKETGTPYGFISYIPKTKMLAFKQGVPPKELTKGKLGKGLACSNVSTITTPLNLILALGKELVKAGQSDLGCNEKTIYEIKGTKKTLVFPNSVRVCTVLDFVLRYMDKVKVDNKRWFYRGLEAKLHNHPYK
jgi:hypothetical protein